MKKSRIYNLAMSTLLMTREKEEKFLIENPCSEISQNRLKNLDKEIEELHKMILQAEFEEKNNIK